MALGSNNGIEAMFSRMLAGPIGRPMPLDIADPNDPANWDPNHDPNKPGWPIGGPFGPGYHLGPGNDPRFSPSRSYLQSPATQAFREAHWDPRSANRLIQLARHDRLIFEPEDVIGLRRGHRVVEGFERPPGLTHGIYEGLQQVESRAEARKRRRE